MAAGTVDHPELTEASGLVASVQHPDTLWTHNDDGDNDGELYAIATDGRLLSTLTLSGVAPVDWESVTTSTARGLPELLVGDIGDNDEARDTITVLITAEPDTLADSMQAGVVERLTISLPDGPRDSEAMVVDPQTNQLLLFTRGADQASVYAVDWTAGGPTTAVGAMELNLDAPPFQGLGSIRAADVGSDGSVVLRLTDGVVWFPNAGDVLTSLEGEGCRVPSPAEPNGEGVAVADSALYFIGEGSTPTLWTVSGDAP